MVKHIVMIPATSTSKQFIPAIVERGYCPIILSIIIFIINIVLTIRECIGRRGDML